MTKLITLRDILNSKGIKDKTLIKYKSGDCHRFNLEGTYRVYISWGICRVYDNDSTIWNTRPLPSRIFDVIDRSQLATTRLNSLQFKTGLDCLFEIVDKSKKEPTDKSSVAPPNTHLTKLDNNWNMYNTCSKTWTSTTKEKVMSIRTEKFLKEMNNGIDLDEAKQIVCEDRTVKIDLLTVLKATTIFKDLNLGTESLLQDLIFDGETIVCRLTTGAVDSEITLEEMQDD
jgi:hypothetical protein